MVAQHGEKFRPQFYQSSNDMLQFLVAILACIPVSGFWDRRVTTKCIDIALYYLALTVPNIATDLILLAFPLPFIWKLRLPKSQKVALTGIFTLGGL